VKDDRLYLAHILEAIEKIQRYTADGRDAFAADTRTQDAVLRNFEIIGEATKRLSPEVRDRQPDIPWKQIAGFRDVLIHDYMGVDIDEVWNVVEHSLSPLLAAVRALLGE
jgi:uncharacterized protein with HEPN domain